MALSLVGITGRASGSLTGVPNLTSGAGINLNANIALRIPAALIR